MQHQFKIIGIGSPFGLDQVAWHVIDLLDESMLACKCDRPGINLLPLMKDVDHIVLIDAMKMNAPLGTVRQLSIADLPKISLIHSSHGFGVIQAIEMAKALNELPDKVTIFAIEIGDETADINDDVIQQAVRNCASKLNQLG